MEPGGRGIYRHLLTGPHPEGCRYLVESQWKVTMPELVDLASNGYKLRPFRVDGVSFGTVNASYKLSTEFLMTGAELAAARKNRGLTEVELGKAIGYRDPARAVRRLEAAPRINARAMNMIKVIFGTVDQDYARERGTRRRSVHPDQLAFAF